MSLRTRIERLEDALDTQQARSKPVEMTPFEKWRRFGDMIETARYTGENRELAEQLVAVLEIGPVHFHEPDPNRIPDSDMAMSKRLAKALGLGWPPKRF